MFRTWPFNFFFYLLHGGGHREEGGNGGGIMRFSKKIQPRSLRSKHHVDVAGLVVGNTGAGGLVHRCPSRSPVLPVTSASARAHTYCSSPLRDSTILSSPAILPEGIDAQWAL